MHPAVLESIICPASTAALISLGVRFGASHYDRHAFSIRVSGSKRAGLRSGTQRSSGLKVTVVFDAQSNLATQVSLAPKDDNQPMTLADSKKICASIGLTNAQKDNDGSGFYHWGQESDSVSTALSPGDELTIESR
jgi:hypothetical protein